jgi:hypothetical protein
LHCPEIAQRLAISANTRVFPKPRPARSNQIDQSPGGGSWLCRAVTSHERRRFYAAGRLASPLSRILGPPPRSASGCELVHIRAGGSVRICPSLVRLELYRSRRSNSG